MLRKTFSCSELCSRWDIKTNDLTDIVYEEKLKALNDKYPVISKEADGYIYTSKVGTSGVWSPTPLTINDENGFYFSFSAVEAYEKENGITPHELPTVTLQDEQILLEQRYRDLEQELFGLYFDKASKPDYIEVLKKKIQRLKKKIKENQESILPAHENAFIHQGDAWQIWFKGKKLNPIKDMDGLIYIANILLNPLKDLSVIDLCDAIQCIKSESMISKDDMADSLNEENMSISTMKDDGHDDKRNENVKMELQKLRKELIECQKAIADPELPESERIEASKAKKRIIQILEAYRKHPSRKINRSVKRCMDRAKKGINRAIDRIRKQSPELADYLEKTIKTGTQYSFTDRGTPWHISL